MTELLYTAAQLLDMPMTVLFEHSYEGTPFSMKGITCPKDDELHWPTSALLIFRNGVLLGGYRRTYPSYAVTTFMPFEWEGQWYALYSANYTSTRVMLLNETSLDDWCGEEPKAYGFCPTEYFTPQMFVVQAEDYSVWQVNDKTVYPTFAEFQTDAADSEAEVVYTGFGFLSGCVWGDDSAWKLRYVDYSRVAEKVLIIDERFGYHPLPSRPLSECVDLSCWEPEIPTIFTSKREHFCIK